jgi:hypothetical protein
VNPEDAQDVQAVHALQDAIKVSQNNPGSFQIPKWDPPSKTKIREALLVLKSTLPDLKHALGAKRSGRSGSLSHRVSGCLGRKPRQGRHLSESDSGKK